METIVDLNIKEMVSVWIKVHLNNSVKLLFLDHTKKNPHTSILWQSQLGNNQYQTQNSIFQKQNTVFGLQDQNTNSSSIVDIDTLVKSVVNDMEVIEKSGQWLLTCYGPFKEKPIFPGFEDFCFEEIRSGFYEAMKNGTIEQYVRDYITLFYNVRFKNIHIFNLFLENSCQWISTASNIQNSIFAQTNT